MAEDAHLRIGELSRRSGVSPELLRAWERRYGLLRPQRSAGGLRLYSSGDLERVRAMQRHMTQGLAAREAAALAGQATAEAAPPRTGVTAFDPDRARAELGAALEAFDEPEAQAVFDALLSIATLDALLSDVVMPYLHDLGDRWERGSSPSRRSTSLRTSCEDACWAWRAGGVGAPARARSSPVPKASDTTSA